MKRIAGFMIGFVACFAIAHLFAAFVFLHWLWFTDWSNAARAFALPFATYCGAWGYFIFPRWLEKVKPR